MRVLLDTHILYWWFYEPEKLSSVAVGSIKDAEEVFFSSASLWEVAIKVRLGKIKADPRRILRWARQSDFIELPIFSRHTLLVATLPLHHSDPFDRLLISQAMSEPLHLLTVDTQLKRYSKLVVLV
jgi:PIN domain nuclease of toxin-antitoxin system